MSPGLKPGQNLAIRPMGPEGLAAGQIVVFRNHVHRLTIHRFIRREPNGKFLSRGDNSPAADALWTSKDFVGILEAAESRDGFWIAPSGGVPTRLHFWLQGARPQRLFHAIRAVLTPLAWRRTTSPVFTQSKRYVMKTSNEVAETVPRFETQELGNELAVYDNQSGDLHVLNEIAALVYKSTIRGRTLEEIALDVSGRWPDIQPDRVRTDVTSVLDQLVASGLITRDP